MSAGRARGLTEDRHILHTLFESKLHRETVIRHLSMEDVSYILRDKRLKRFISECEGEDVRDRTKCQEIMLMEKKFLPS